LRNPGLSTTIIAKVAKVAKVAIIIHLFELRLWEESGRDHE